MKKFLFFFLLVQSLYAGHITFQGNLVKDSLRIKHIQNDVIFLDDDTVLKLYPVKERTPNLKEWWNGVAPQQPDLLFLRDFSSLEEGQELELYQILPPTEPILEIYGHTVFQKAEYLVYNVATGQYAFARFALPDQYMMQFLSLDGSEYNETVLEDLVFSAESAFLVLANGAILETITITKPAIALPIDGNMPQECYPCGCDPKGSNPWLYLTPVDWQREDELFIFSYDYFQDLSHNHHRWKLYFKDVLSRGEYIVYNRAKEHFLLVKGLKSASR